MLKASALYIVIIIALAMAVLCSSMIVSAYFYRLQYQKKFRSDVLRNNLESGVNILLAADSNAYQNEQILDLYHSGSDSISLKLIPWGVYDIGVVKAFIHRDTIFKTFSLAYSLDSLTWGAIYLTDEEKPLFVSGHTKIRGTAFLPKAGIKEAFIEGKSYLGDKRLVIGQQKKSNSNLPLLKASQLTFIKHRKQYSSQTDSLLPDGDSLNNSFLNPTKTFHFKKRVVTLKDIKLQGNIALFSDTLIAIDGSATLDNVLVFAKVIVVESGFKGRCQLFATDSIRVKQNCRFNYPSCIGVLKFESKNGSQAKISLGDASSFSGILFTYENPKSDFQTLIDIGKKVKINGQVFAQGIIRFKDSVVVNGNISANRLIYETNYTMFENYLMNTVVDQVGLSPFYLTSSLFAVSSGKRKIMQWLETK